MATTTPENKLLQVNKQDHILGRSDAPVTLIEYADFQCPYCQSANGVVDQLLGMFPDDLQYVFRHYPLEDVHELAREAAQAAEAASLQDKFWELHEALFANQENLEPESLDRYAGELGLDMDRFTEDFDSPEVLERIEADVQNGDKLEVDQTPTFFINGERYEGSVDVESIAEEIRKVMDGRREAA